MKLLSFRIAPETPSAPPSSFWTGLALALTVACAGCGGSVTEGTGGHGGDGGGTTSSTTAGTSTSSASTSTSDTTTTTGTTTTTDENACVDAGGACVALVPDACENGTWLDAAEYPCGTGEGVGCCLIAVCTPGMDQTCNADLSMSSFAGKCNDDGTCTCNEGFTKNADGKCG
jgi:hypothetical protein